MTTLAPTQIALATAARAPFLTPISTAAETRLATISPTRTPIPTPCSIASGTSFKNITGDGTLSRRLGCPINQETSPQSAVELFQGGFLAWRGGSSDLVYAVFNNKTWDTYPKKNSDRFTEGSDPEFSCGVPTSPPSPRRGFSKLWCNNPSLKSLLGDAQDYELGYCMTGGGKCESFQDFQNGTLYRSTRFGVVYVLFTDKTWEKR